MAIPSSREDLINYCLRTLGAPVIEINVDQDQIEDRVDEAIQKFQNWHFQGVYRTYLKHTITQADIDNEFIPTDNSIVSVIKLFPWNSALSKSNVFTQSFVQSNLSNIFSGAGIDLIGYDTTKQYINLIDEILVGQQSLRFNKHMNKIFLDLSWKNRFNVDDIIIFEVWQIVDPDTYSDVWNDELLKRYTTALIKKQWGNNLKKYNGVELVGGVTLNGKEIYDEAIEELKELDDEITEKWTVPPHFIVG